MVSTTQTETLNTPVPLMFRLIKMVKFAKASMVQADTTAAECWVTSWTVEARVLTPE